MELIETRSYFSEMRILTNKAPLVLITYKSYYNLSIKAENYQLD